MKYVIGVDCGGTKTKAEAYDLNGNVIATELAGFGNLLVDYEVAKKNIRYCVDNLLNTLEEENCQQIVFGVAGIDSGGLKNKLIHEFSYLKIPQVFLNDGQLAHYSILKGKDGIVITAGTGSVFIGRSNEIWYRVGGWGLLFGDEGGAYKIAQSAIKNCLDEFDNGFPPSNFSNKILDYFSAKDIFSLVKKVYQLNKGEIAKLSSLVAEQANYDQIPLNILNEAGHQLAFGVSTLINKMDIQILPIRVGLNGSVIKNNQFVRDSFYKSLINYDSEKKFEFIEKQNSSAKGAYYYFIAKSEKLNN